MDSNPTPENDKQSPTPEPGANTASSPATKLPATEEKSSGSFWVGFGAYFVIPLVTGTWFFPLLGFQTLLHTEMDLPFSLGIVGGIAVLVFAFVAARKNAFLRGLAVGGWATLMQIAGFASWTNSSELLHGSASGGNGAMAGLFQLLYMTVVYLVAGGIGALGAASLLPFVVALETELRKPAAPAAR